MSHPSERGVALAKTGFYVLAFASLIDIYVSYLTHDVSNVRSMFDFDLANPKPETYNTYALIASFAAMAGLTGYVARSRRAK